MTAMTVQCNLLHSILLLWLNIDNWAFKSCFHAIWTKLKAVWICSFISAADQDQTGLNWHSASSRKESRYTVSNHRLCQAYLLLHIAFDLCLIFSSMLQMNPAAYLVWHWNEIRSTCKVWIPTGVELTNRSQLWWWHYISNLLSLLTWAELKMTTGRKATQIWCKSTSPKTRNIGLFYKSCTIYAFTVPVLPTKTLLKYIQAENLHSLASAN